MKTCTPEAFKLLLDGSDALARMEHAGIKIDVEYLERTIAETSEKIKQLESNLREGEVYEAWRKRYGQKTNLGSRQQLAEVLFNVLKHPYPGGDENRTATNRQKADEETLALVDDPFARDFLQVEKLKRLRGTYLYGIKREMVDGFVHPVINLHTVDTYRSSSNSPNFQNQTNRDPELAPILRRCYVARKPDRRLVEVDFSTLEGRMLACFWGDQKLIDYMNDPTKDLHRDVAKQLFFLKNEQVEKKTTRDWAKNRFVFPVFYGSYWRNCARHIWEAVPGSKLPDGTLITKHLKSHGINGLGPCEPKVDPVRGTFAYHVREVERRFNADFPGFGDGKEDWWKLYCKRGWFRLMSGFVCRGKPYSKNNLMNTPAQGPGFHCLLWAIPRIQWHLDKYKMKARPIAEIHDCLLGDVPEVELQDYLHLCRKVMTKDLRKAFPWIVTEMGVEVDCTPLGGNWADKKPWVLDGKGTWVIKEK